MTSETIHLAMDVELIAGKKISNDQFSFLYEGGRVRYFRFRDTEVLRLIYTAVRDENWDTADIIISDESIKDENHETIIRYTATYGYHGNNVFQADIDIRLSAQQLLFSFKGRALQDFKRNRIGICVLHPVSHSFNSGIRITQPDQQESFAEFPRLVSPHQPAKNINKMVWRVHQDYEAQLECTGDIFEMEDQRNWADLSYKTYGTPVDLPLPVEIRAGDIVEQSVKLSFLSADKQEPAVTVTTKRRLPMPEIGYCRVHDYVLTEQDISLLREIPFHHYRVKLFINADGWKEVLISAAEEARLLGTKLELILLMSDPVEDLVQVISSYAESVASILIVDAYTGKPSRELFAFAKRSFSALHPAIKMGYGTNNHFADLNRMPPSEEGYDFLSYGVTPQAHANDTRTIIENIAAPIEAVEKIRSVISSNAAIHVSPLTLSPRSGGSAVPDKRFHTSFTTFWALAVLAGLEVNQVTLFQTTGDNGILHNGQASPLYEALRKIKQFHPIEVMKDLDAEKPAVVFFNENGEELRFEMDRRFFEVEG